VKLWYLVSQWILRTFFIFQIFCNWNNKWTLRTWST